MKIYRLAPPEGYAFLNTVGGWEALQALKTFGTGSAEIPLVEVVLERRYEEDADDHLTSSDFPWLAGNAPAYSKRAADALRAILELHGTLVPLAGAAGAYCALDVRIRLNAIDYERSRVQRFSSGEIMMIEEYAFHADAVAGWAIFMDRDWDEVFVSQDYVDAVAETGLPGAGFALLADHG